MALVHCTWPVMEAILRLWTSYCRMEQIPTSPPWYEDSYICTVFQWSVLLLVQLFSTYCIICASYIHVLADDSKFSDCKVVHMHQPTSFSSPSCLCILHAECSSICFTDNSCWEGTSRDSWEATGTRSQRQPPEQCEEWVHVISQLQFTSAIHVCKTRLLVFIMTMCSSPKWVCITNS